VATVWLWGIERKSTIFLARSETSAVEGNGTGSVFVEIPEKRRLLVNYLAEALEVKEKEERERTTMGFGE